MSDFEGLLGQRRWFIRCIKPLRLSLCDKRSVLKIASSMTWSGTRNHSRGLTRLHRPSTTRTQPRIGGVSMGVAGFLVGRRVCELGECPGACEPPSFPSERDYLLHG